jgi:hypothetical protein
MSSEIITFMAAIVVAALAFSWAIKILKASVSTAIAIIVFLLILQLGFGVHSQDIWEQVVKLPQTLQVIWQQIQQLLFTDGATEQSYWL